MRLGKELIGRPVFSVTDGRLLGTVKDLYLDAQLDTLSGVFLGQEGLISRKSLLIDREHITIFGLDAILAQGPDVVTDSDQHLQSAAWIRREQLQGRQIDTPGGTRVGTIGDVLFDEKARVLGFSLARVFVEGPVARNRMVMKDAVVDSGSIDGIMTIDLAKAELQSLESH